MSATRSDALVFFGATGDLAYKKIFPALQAMARRGHLDVPVIGVAKDARNTLRFRLSPDVSITLGARVKQDGEQMVSEGAELKFVRRPTADELDAYERLLVDAMAGDATLFAREDGVEAAWRVVHPTLDDPTPVREYAPGTWGPDEAAALTADVGGWHAPLGAGSG